MIDTREIKLGESISVTSDVNVTIPVSFGAGLRGGIVIFDGHLTSIGENFLLEGNAKCRIETNCSLCLAPMEFDINFSVSEIFTETPNDDAIVFVGKIIDLLPAVERNLFASMTMKPICSEDCAGLCQSCGKNLNEGICGCGTRVNEQFSELLKLFED